MRRQHTCGSDDVSVINGVAHGNIIQCAIYADIAHCGESGHQKRSWIGDGLKCNFRGRLLKIQEWISVIFITDIGQMCVAINQSWKNGLIGKINDLGPGTNRQRLTDGFDFVVVDEDDLIGQDCAGVGINQPARFDSGDLRETRSGKKDKKPEMRKLVSLVPPLAFCKCRAASRLL
jgi:hypothetical protein